MIRVTDPELSRLPPLSRRRGPRVPVRDLLTARTVNPHGPEVLAVRDLGFRGFAIETSSAVPARTRARFAFSSANSPLFEADAVSVHCFLQPGSTDRWVSGWEFPEQEGLDARIEHLMEEAVGVITID